MKKVLKKPRAVASLESSMIRTIRARGAVSRVELARQLSLVASTAGLYVDRLIERGYLVESRKTTRALGRPPVMLKLNPLGGRFIGLDFDARRAYAFQLRQIPVESEKPWSAFTCLGLASTRIIRTSLTACNERG